MTYCDNKPEIKNVFFVKKGMAQKAMLNNLATGNIKNLEKQIKKGTVKILKP